MPWIFLMTGLFLLALAGILTYCFRRQAASSGFRACRRLPFPHGLQALMRRAAMLPPPHAGGSAFTCDLRSLAAHVARAGKAILQCPPLPTGADRLPRMLSIAEELLDAADFTPSALLDALSCIQDNPLRPSEAAFFPACVKAVQCRRLKLVLSRMLQDAKERSAAPGLVRRLMRSKHPLRFLERTGLHSAGMAVVLAELHEQNAVSLLSDVSQWLDARGTSPDRIAAQALERELRFAEELRRAGEIFSCLEHMNWLSRCEAADPIHRQLLDDPSGLYTRMTCQSRLDLRLKIESFARRVSRPPEQLLEHARCLSLDAEAHSPETFIGYWFLDAGGLRALHQALRTARGTLYALTSLRADAVRYAFCLLYGLLFGFLFLQAGHPVFMLPFFALCAGCVIRGILNRTKPSALPALDITPMQDELRTLVILPALLTDAHAAIRQTRRMKTLLHTFPEPYADFLLLGDFPDSMTAVSSSDAAIVAAAATAVAALENRRCHYLQRGRTWHPDRHTCTARGGRRGAVTDICRLIAQGECSASFVYSTLEPASLERRYAYVLALPDDRQISPGMLETLLQVMTHPLCSRLPVPGGHHGYSVLSPEGTELFDGIGLIRPDAFLEATDGLVDDDPDADSLCGELAGHAAVPGAALDDAAPDPSWDVLYHDARTQWRHLRWQLPWVQTPSGLIRNPLKHRSRFRLREMLRTTLVPLGQYSLLLWAVVTGSWPLFLLGLAAPELSRLPRRLNDWLQLIRRLSLLPTQALVPLHALWDILRRKAPPASIAAFEIWAQGVSATILIALGFAFPGMALPALAAGTLFACFPLAHQVGSRPFPADKGLTEELLALLEQLGENTWKFFCQQTSAENHFLPPCAVQFDPPAGPEASTSPEAIAAGMLAFVCAVEMALLTPNDAAGRLQQLLAALDELSMPFGLPCRRYSLPSLTVEDARVDASGAGILLAALMTTAQALRCWLPGLESRFLPLSAEAERLASRFDLSRLYNAEADLFHLQLDENGQGVGFVTCLADEALLLSVAACARRRIPPRHFQHLSKARVHVNSKDIPLSRAGTATEHLLAGLFLPIDEGEALDFIAIMQQSAHSGCFGQGSCGCFRFDPALHYRRKTFGVQEIALSATSSDPVFAPYAAALCLPYVPHSAAGALLRFHQLGASGPLGMCDAVDFTQGQALVGMHDTLHQGIMLMCIAHILADAPVQRFFCGLPEVEACLPLLHPRGAPLILPVLPVRHASDAIGSAVPHAAEPRMTPPAVHLTGTKDFRILTDAWGSTALFDGTLPLTRFDPSAESPQGLQFYLADEGRVYRVGEPRLSGQVLFAPGETRFEQLCGSMKAELVTVADTVRRRALHILTITNLSTRDRVIDAADCLLPDLSAPHGTLEVRREEPHRLQLRARGSGHVLHHTLSCSLPPLSLTVCTDTSAFLGRNRTLTNPASLEEPASDCLSLSEDPCLSFRVRLTLVGRGQATLWFTTSLQEHEPPLAPALSGLRRLAALQHEAIDALLPLEDGQHSLLRQLLPLLMQSENRLALDASPEEPGQLLPDLIPILDRLHLQGGLPEVWITCPDDGQQSIRLLLTGHACEEQITLSPAAPPAAWENALVLRENTPLAQQLDACYAPIPAEPASPRPRPALLPREELAHRSPYGGFDPQSSDYVIELEPGMTTPAPWENVHATRAFRETVDECGLRAPFGEEVQLTLPDGTILSPWAPELPRSIRMANGLTSWEAWSDQLDLCLCAACLPGHRCGLRLLRLRNTTDTPLEVRLTIRASLGSRLECTRNAVMGTPDGQALFPYLAADGWTPQLFTPHPLPDSGASQDSLPGLSRKHLAVLSTTIQLPSQGSGEACWLAGFARHAGDSDLALDVLRQSGKSALLRTIQARHAQPLNTLTIATPEDTFDLLMNSILPRQALCAKGIASVPALLYLAPNQARWRLLEQARITRERDEWAMLAPLLADCVRITGDRSLPDAWLPRQGKALFPACRDALLSLPLDRRGLPFGEDSTRRCFLFAVAAQALARCIPDTELDEFGRKLLNAADTCLWDDICYGTPLRLDVQALSCLAYGANPRTRQAVRTAWLTLYDPYHGLIRRQEPMDLPPLPGLPENGGMITTDAILTLRALLLTAHDAEAHELMRALNPVHHCDDPLRMESFRCAPYRLHGGMLASPLEAGRGYPEGGSEAAALLYAVLLKDVLGLHRDGKTLHIHPHVPPDWDDYALTLREGSATWHISVEKAAKIMTIDGDETHAGVIRLHDDGHIHQVRIPLK